MKTLLLLADLALAEHRPLVALTLLAAVYGQSPFCAPAEGLAPKDLDIALVYEAELQKALESLADEDVQAALAAGRAMSYAETVRYAREQFGREG